MSHQVHLVPETVWPSFRSLYVGREVACVKRSEAVRTSDMMKDEVQLTRQKRSIPTLNPRQSAT